MDQVGKNLLFNLHHNNNSLNNINPILFGRINNADSKQKSCEIKNTTATTNRFKINKNVFKTLLTKSCYNKNINSLCDSKKIYLE